MVADAPVRGANLSTNASMSAWLCLPWQIIETILENISGSASCTNALTRGLALNSISDKLLFSTAVSLHDGPAYRTAAYIMFALIFDTPDVSIAS